MRIPAVIVITHLLLLPQLPTAAAGVVIPKPREMRATDQELVIRGKADVRPVFAKDERPLVLAADELTLLLSLPRPAGKATRITLASRESGAAPDLRALGRKWNIATPDKPEAYALKVTPEEIIIIGADDPGLFYGIQTLKQLITMEPDGFRVPVCEIADSPSLAYRGVHIYTGSNALAEQKRLVDVLAGLKMNHIVLEVDFLEFKNFPELRYEPYAQSQEEVRALIAHARDRYITIAPQVSSLGHAEWAFQMGHHLDLAEDPDNPAAFNITNPRTYQFLYAIFDEIIALFETDTIHIGLDEVDHFGRFPHRPETQKYTMTEILDIFLARLIPYFESKNIRTVMLWGDMFLAPGEAGSATHAKTLRDAMARRAILHNAKRLHPQMDFIICDWHYEPAAPEQFTSLAIFQEQGLRTLASTWYRPVNIRNFTHQAIAERSYGLLHTSWAGFNFRIEAMPEERHKFSAYLLAADYAWSGRDEHPDDLPYFHHAEFWRRWHDSTALGGGAKSTAAIPFDMVTSIFGDEAWVEAHPVLSPAEAGRQKPLEYQLSGHISNPFDRPAEVQVSVEAPFAVYETLLLPPRTRRQQLPGAVASLPEPATPQSHARVDFKVKIEGMPAFEFRKEAKIAPVWRAVALSAPATVDGDFSEWTNVAPYVFASREFVAIKKSWSPEDLSARLYAGHHDQKLFLAIEATDDTHFNDRADGWIWEGDCIQLAFDFLYDRAPYYSSAHAELGFALDNDGEIRAHVWHSHFRDPGILDVMEYAIRREGNTTRYEVMIPLDALNNPEILKQQWIGFAFSVNDNDGKGFTGGVIGSQGVYGEDKNPSHFGTLILEKTN